MGTRVNPVGWFIVIFFLIGGVVFWVTIPDIFIGQIWVGVSLLLIVIYTVVMRRAKAAQQLMREGSPGRATIVEMTQTGVYINEQPQVKLKLRVEASGITTYELEKTVVVPMIALGSLSGGRPLSVYVDPADHERIAIDWSAGLAAPAAAVAAQPVPAQADGHAAATPMERLTKLMELRNAQLITDEEFAQQKKRILEDV